MDPTNAKVALARRSIRRVGSLLRVGASPRCAQRQRERTASALDRPATPAAPLRYPPISLAVVFSSAVGLPAERWGRRTCGKSEGVEKGEGELKTPEGDEVGWRPFVRGFVCELAQQAMSAHKACTSGSTGCLVCWSVTGV
jgi:hypothetical protein